MLELYRFDVTKIKSQEMLFLEIPHFLAFLSFVITIKVRQESFSIFIGRLA